MASGEGPEKEERKYYVKLDNCFVGDRDYRGDPGFRRNCGHRGGACEDFVFRIPGVVRPFPAVWASQRLITFRRSLHMDGGRKCPHLWHKRFAAILHGFGNRTSSH